MAERIYRTVASDRELELQKKLAIDNAVTIIRSCGTPVRGGDWYKLDPSEFPFKDESQALLDSVEYLVLIRKLEKHTTMPYLVRII